MNATTLINLIDLVLELAAISKLRNDDRLKDLANASEHIRKEMMVEIAGKIGVEN